MFIEDFKRIRLGFEIVWGIIGIDISNQTNSNNKKSNYLFHFKHVYNFLSLFIQIFTCYEAFYCGFLFENSNIKTYFSNGPICLAWLICILQWFLKIWHRREIIKTMDLIMNLIKKTCPHVTIYRMQQKHSESCLKFLIKFFKLVFL